MFHSSKMNGHTSGPLPLPAWWTNRCITKTEFRKEKCLENANQTKQPLGRSSVINSTTRERRQIRKKGRLERKTTFSSTECRGLCAIIRQFPIQGFKVFQIDRNSERLLDSNILLMLARVAFLAPTYRIIMFCLNYCSWLNSRIKVF